MSKDRKVYISGGQLLANQSDRIAAEQCMDCMMAWFLYGDGAKCLVPGHGKVYWIVDTKQEKE